MKKYTLMWYFWYLLKFIPFFSDLKLCGVLPRCMECRRGLAMRILSVKRVHCDKMEETSVQIFLPYKRTFNLVY